MVAILAVAIIDAVLLTASGVVYRKARRFRPVFVDRIKWLSIGLTAFGLLVSLASHHVILSMLLAVNFGCIVFLGSCWSSWLSDKALHLVEHKMEERPKLKEAMEKNVILRTVWRMSRWENKGQ